MAGDVFCAPEAQTESGIYSPASCGTMVKAARLAQSAGVRRSCRHRGVFCRLPCPAPQNKAQPDPRHASGRSRQSASAGIAKRMPQRMCVIPPIWASALFRRQTAQEQISDESEHQHDPGGDHVCPIKNLRPGDENFRRPVRAADNADGRKAAQIRDGFQKPGQQRKHRRAKADEPQRAFAERVARQLRGKLCRGLLCGPSAAKISASVCPASRRSLIELRRSSITRSFICPDSGSRRRTARR